MRSKWMKQEIQEIDLIELTISLCKQWKGILLCALVFACLLGGYQFIRSGQNSTPQQSEGVVTRSSEEIFKELTDIEQKGVQTAVVLTEEIQDYQEYLEHSVYANLDPYHVNQTALLYAINGATKKEKQKILKSYLSYLQNGGLAKEIAAQSTEKITEEDLIGMISAWSEQEDGLQIATEDTVFNAVFTVQLLGKDDGMADAFADITEQALASQEKVIGQKVSGHSLQLLDRQTGIISVEGIASGNRDKRYNMSLDTNSLKTMTDAFSEGQKEAYQALLNEKGLIEAREQTQQVAGNPTDATVSPKYILLGFIGGAFVYCVCFAILYILRDTIKSVKEIKESYTFPFYGAIRLKKGTSGTGEDLTGQEKDAYARDKAQMLQRIKLACQKDGIAKVYLTTCFSLNEQEKSYLGNLLAQLKSWDIEVISGENIMGDISQWENLTKTGQVIVLYKIGTTTRRMTLEEHAFYMENDVDILGAIAIEN